MQKSLFGDGLRIAPKLDIPKTVICVHAAIGDIMEYGNCITDNLGSNLGIADVQMKQQVFPILGASSSCYHTIVCSTALQHLRFGDREYCHAGT